MKIIIDTGAGVCPGVARAIRMAEEKLAQQELLVSVGSLIHNEVEVGRLAAAGLQTIPQEFFETSNGLRQEFSGKRLLIRAHGISPKLQNKFESNELEILDATCPKVKRVQQVIRKYSADGYQVVIVGKENHPEVIGLAGSALGAVFVILQEEDITRIPVTKKTLLVAQTTTNQANFEQIAEFMKRRFPELVVKNTICSAVSNRHQKLQTFARSCDAVLFVGGHHSSNTRELYQICHGANPKSFRIEKSAEVDFDWFSGAETIGISGSASTPVWQLHEIAKFLTAHFQDGFTKINLKEVLLNG